MLLLQGKGISKSMPRDGWGVLLVNQPPTCWSSHSPGFTPEPLPSCGAPSVGPCLHW